MLVSMLALPFLLSPLTTAPAPSPTRPSLYHYPPSIEFEMGGMDTAERERTASGIDVDQAWPYGKAPPREHAQKRAHHHHELPPLSVFTRFVFLGIPLFFLRAHPASVVLPLVILIVPYLLSPVYSSPSPPSPNSTSRTSRFRRRVVKLPISSKLRCLPPLRSCFP
jgi:hypothetical protein